MASTTSTTLVQQPQPVTSQQQQQVLEAQAGGDAAAKKTETITLTLVPRRKKKSVKWSEDVEEVNELSGKRKSKKCCIFHKQRQPGEWSDADSEDECQC